jgi:hypothetical protein
MLERIVARTFYFQYALSFFVNAIFICWRFSKLFEKIYFLSLCYFVLHSVHQREHTSRCLSI